MKKKNESYYETVNEDRILQTHYLFPNKTNNLTGLVSRLFKSSALLRVFFRRDVTARVSFLARTKPRDRSRPVKSLNLKFLKQKRVKDKDILPVLFFIEKKLPFRLFRHLFSATERISINNVSECSIYSM